MKFPAGMFTKYMVLGLSLAGACKGHVPQDTRCSSLTGISVLKVCLTESLTLLPNRVNRLRHKKRVSRTATCKKNDLLTNYSGWVRGDSVSRPAQTGQKLGKVMLFAQ